MNSIQEEAVMYLKRNKKLSILSIIINLGVLGCIGFLFATYELIGKMGIRYASNAPISTIAISMIILSGIGCYLNMKQRSWTTIVLIPILALSFLICFITVMNYSADFNSVSSYYSQSSISGRIILSETPRAINKFRIVSFVPLISAIAYLVTYIKCKK